MWFYKQTAILCKKNDNWKKWLERSRENQKQWKSNLTGRRRKALEKRILKMKPEKLTKSEKAINMNI